MAIPALLALLAPLAPLSPAQDASGPRGPSVLIVLTDDQGLGDLGVTGNPVLATPHIDRLAAEGASMRRFYVSPVCTPTRAALLTGRNSLRTRAVDTYRGRAMMAPEEVTLAEVLRDAGYATGLFGKWHLGDSHPMRPRDQGFEEVLGHRGGGLAQPADAIENDGRYTDPILYRDGVEQRTRGFCMDVYTDAALDFIERSVESGRPFLAYLATNTPHGPFHDVPMELYEELRGRDLSPLVEDPRRVDDLARCYAMVENVDRNVGRLLDGLEALEVADRTIVVYLHDNGPNLRRYTAGLRGMKSEVYEGGIRSPLFVRWPGVVPAGLERDEVAAHVDLWPTLLEATGVRAPAVQGLDGRSLWPLLRGLRVDWSERLVHLQAHRGDRRVVEHNFAVVGRRYKLLRASGFGRERLPEDPAPLELYDLLADPGETRDLAGERPELVAELLAAHRAWFAEASDHPGFGTPPAIRLDLGAVPVHELNRNDWRPTGPGYGDAGAWLVELQGELELDALLRVRSAPAGEDPLQVRITLDGRPLRESVYSEARTAGRPLRIVEPGLRLDAGTHWLGVELLVGDGRVPCEHLVLAAPGELPAR